MAGVEADGDDIETIADEIERISTLCRRTAGKSFPPRVYLFL
jgi:hypothetical protein